MHSVWKYSVAAASIMMGFGLAGAAYAAGNSDSADADISATVITPIDIVNVDGLQFGEFTVGSAAGTVTIGVTGSQSCGGGASCLGGTVGAADFTVTGEPNRSYNITLPSTASVTSGGNSMTVDSFTSSPVSPDTLSASGDGTLAVGATLQVGADQAPGDYSGSFSVTVTYQ